jgi:hypothetical protein
VGGAALLLAPGEGKVGPTDMSLAMELLVRAEGPALDCRESLGAGPELVVFLCCTNQVAAAAPATINKIFFAGLAFVFGNASGAIMERLLRYVCGTIPHFE